MIHNYLSFILIQIFYTFYYASGQNVETSGQLVDATGQLIDAPKDCQDLNIFFGMDINVNCCEEICSKFDSLTEEQCVEINSIECDANNNVIRLKSEVCNFDEKSRNVDFSNFPALPHLKELYIVNMQSTVLPNSLFELPELEILSVTESLVESVANDINTKSPLKEIYLDNNHIKEFPYQFNSLNNLIKLDLNNNEISGELTKDAAKFTSIETLELNNNLNIEILPDEISDLEKLKILGLGNTNLNELPSNIFKLENLKS
eukprot:jgi/Orpsp1_1/1176689/evm.model.c7180000058614.1